ncbi:MAG: hypothetical protein P4L53_18300 [Candidatus Obscuribacterales bacterium]|nr:hypothetical protein [Candidatus Obscuribacterales bacterium]
MFNVCPKCGEYSDEKLISSDGGFAICQTCKHEHPFLRLPLLIITGASGTGKSTVALKLVAEQSAVICLDRDILWRGGIHYLALVCNEVELTRRLKARPAWRKSGTEAVLEGMTKFNQWLIDNATKSAPPMALLDTSELSLDESVDATKKWFSSLMAPSL